MSILPRDCRLLQRDYIFEKLSPNYSRQSEEPKINSVGIFEYILASMLKVYLNMLENTLGWMPSIKMTPSLRIRSKVNGVQKLLNSYKIAYSCNKLSNIYLKSLIYNSLYINILNR